MAARVLAQLGTSAAAAAAAHPACFDAAAAGDSLWVAAHSDERSILVVHALAAGTAGSTAGGSSGSVHATISLPEPVALVQLGASPSQAAAEAEPGAAVLLLVGASCRLWAFQLDPPKRGGKAVQRGPPAEVAAADSDAMAVPLAQPACPARHQLAAAVAWEHLAFSWDPAAVGHQSGSAGGTGRAGGRAHGSRSSTDAEGSAVPLPLHKLAAALRRYGGNSQQQEEHMPLLVHSIASWVFQQPAPAATGSSSAATPAIPADARAAVYVGWASSDSTARLTCKARFELPAAASGGALTPPAGYLLVATAQGQLLALPVGTPASSGQQQQQQQHNLQHQAADDGGALLPIVVCMGGSSMCILPLQAPNEGSSAVHQGGEELVLLAEAGQLGPAAPAGLGSCQTTAIAAGSNSNSDSGAPAAGSALAAGACTATVLLAGVQAAAAVGSTLCYLPLQCDASTGSSRSSSSGLLRCLDLGSHRNLLQATAIDVPLARAGGAAGVGQPLLLATAAAMTGHQPRQQLVMLTSQGTLLAVQRAQLGGDRPAGGMEQQTTVHQLEVGIQALLGGIAQVSEQQEALERQLLALDSSLAGLAAAIPAVEAASSPAGRAAAAGVSRLHCSVRPLGLRSSTQDCRAGSWAGATGIGVEELALEVSLRNSSRLPLAGGWSVLLTYTASSGNSGSRSSSRASSIAMAAPLGSLPPGAEWQRECRVPVACGSHLRVLLCRHSNAAAGSIPKGSTGLNSNSCGSSAPCLLQLHSMRLDSLHLLQPSGGRGRSIGSAGSGWPRPQHLHLQPPPAGAGQAGNSGSSDWSQAKLLLQLPAGLCGRTPAAAALTQQLFEVGLSTQPLAQQEQEGAPPFPAFSLLLPTLGLQTSGAASNRQQAPGREWSSAALEQGTSVSAQLLPAPALAQEQLQLLQVTAAASTPAALLACHCGLCLRALHMQQAAAAAAAAGTLHPWLQLPGGQGTLLPPGIAAQGGGMVAASAADSTHVNEAELDQALLQLRRLRDAAVQLRNAVAPPAPTRPAAEEQRRRRQEQGELQQLVLGARAAMASVPVHVS
ncbi:hypothetical protein ABPG75_000840 [Micractinium tetrahymenae]